MSRRGNPKITTRNFLHRCALSGVEPAFRTPLGREAGRAKAFGMVERRSAGKNCLFAVLPTPCSTSLRLEQQQSSTMYPLRVRSGTQFTRLARSAIARRPPQQEGVASTPASISLLGIVVGLGVIIVQVRVTGAGAGVCDAARVQLRTAHPSNEMGDFIWAR